MILCMLIKVNLFFVFRRVNKSVSIDSTKDKKLSYVYSEQDATNGKNFLIIILSSSSSSSSSYHSMFIVLFSGKVKKTFIPINSKAFQGFISTHLLVRISLT